MVSLETLIPCRDEGWRHVESILHLYVHSRAFRWTNGIRWFCWVRQHFRRVGNGHSITFRGAAEQRKSGPFGVFTDSPVVVIRDTDDTMRKYQRRESLGSVWEIFLP